MGLLSVIGWISCFIIFWGMIGYPLSLIVLNKLFKKENKKDLSYEPTVTIMVVAHNEEKVIREKLQNLLDTDYPIDKLKFLIASDYSTDRTDEIVERFIKEHPERDMRLHKTLHHYGKTNAQNETQELCKTEILVMTDTNAMFEPNAVRELVSYFTDTSIVYVSGQLRYQNTKENNTAGSEGFYWKLDLLCRSIESRFQTITAGNGAIYAVRNDEYKKINPIDCHDSRFPVAFALERKRAVYNPNAIAYEKAGEVVEDEFKRKVRMNRIILRFILPDIRILNPFIFHWFSYFYFGHRTCRYLLWLMHALLLIVNIPLVLSGSFAWDIIFLLQMFFYCIALFGWITKSKNRFVRIVFFYCMTIAAHWMGVINVVTGKAKPVWEKAESTR